MNQCLVYAVLAFAALGTPDLFAAQTRFTSTDSIVTVEVPQSWIRALAAQLPEPNNDLSRAWEVLVSCTEAERQAAVRLDSAFGVVVQSLIERIGALATDSLMANYMRVGARHTLAWLRHREVIRRLGRELDRHGFVDDDDMDTPCREEGGSPDALR